ncbi:sterile alpha motif domain-containing protein 5-like [Bacillus rossius redtenbacheri]|uniref:sterile alpha motif domain-containing protein 5-like n=1 Tax=Bacillus rossius redtenbacheri TaxID=93214 RepID=UPI002FDE7B83
MSSNIVVEWLRSLHLGQYAESFIDNGYDDLEICKQVGDPDLDAIGVFNPAHRGRLLHSVRTLREEGAASVYFTLEETTAMHEECQCDGSSARSSRTSSGKGGATAGGGVAAASSSDSPAASSSAGSAQELGKYLDEYEEGKAELVRIPRIQLKLLLKEKLSQDGIRLSCQPYSTSVSDHYSSDLRCPFGRQVRSIFTIILWYYYEEKVY